jgi:hypothetical protein
MIFGNIFSSSSITCPFCFNENIKKSELKYMCPDGHITNKVSAGGLPKCSTPGCGKTTSIILCPKCEQELHRDLIDEPYLPFSIIGISGSGKTNYITVMLDQLDKAASLRTALAGKTVYTRDNQRQNRKMIFEDHQKPGSTRAGDITPQIWQIKNLNKKKGNDVPTYTFTIFDGAGEAQEQIEQNSAQCRYIAISKALMILIDPMALDSVKKKLDPETYQKSIGGTASGIGSSKEIIDPIVDFIKKSCNIGQKTLIKIPAAIIFTKMDAVMDDFKNRPVSNPSPHVRTGYFDNADARAVHNDIRGWLERNEEGNFINTLEAHFKDFTFFGVSSYGNIPKTVDELDEINPHRVLDPILWLFAKNKFIDAKG